MTGKWLTCIVLVLAVVVAVPALAQQEKASVVQPSPEWQKLSALVGEWAGVFEMPDGKKLDGTLEVRMTGDKSALMHLMERDTPHEMITMIHPDGKRILATHYCAAHNQPRMALVPSKSPNEVAFDFLDGTNIAPGDGHMKGVIFRFVDADHHEEEWTSADGAGKTSSAVFKYTRIKK